MMSLNLTLDLLLVLEENIWAQPSQPCKYIHTDSEMFLLSEVSSDMIFDQILKPETDETFFRNVQAALLFEICVLGSDLVPGVVACCFYICQYQTRKKLPSTIWTFCPKNNLVLYLMVHCTESFCLLVHEVDFTYLRAPSLLRNAKVPLTTFSTPWSMQCFKWSQNCNRLKQLPGQNSSQT